MEFLNATVDLENLPRAEDALLHPIDRAYLRVLRWEWLIGVLVLLVILGVLIGSIPGLHAVKWIILMAAAWSLVSGSWFFLQEKVFHTRAFAVRDRDIIYQSGWIIRDLHTCPFNRVLHCTVTAGPLERKYGIATLVLYTAGPGDTDLRVRGLKEAEAYALKEWIAKKIADEPVAG